MSRPAASRAVAAVLGCLAVVLSLTGATFGTTNRPGTVSASPAATWGTDGKVYVLARVGSTVFLGGAFSHVVDPRTGRQVRAANLAAFDASSGAPKTGFSAGTNGAILTLRGSRDARTLYLGGQFTTAHGKARAGLAAVTTSSGALLPVAPQAGGTVRTLLPLPGKVIVGGDFTKLNGRFTERIGAVDDAKGATMRGWSASASCRVQALAASADGKSLYAGGYATAWDGVIRPGLARLSVATGAIDTSFNANYVTNQLACDPVKAHDGNNPFDIAVTPAAVFVALGGKINTLQALRPTGQEYWHDYADGDFQTLVLLGDYVYAGGHFTTWVSDSCGQKAPAMHVVRVNGLSGCVDPTWGVSLTPKDEPGHFYGVWSLTTDGSSLFAGGEFLRTYTVLAGRGRPTRPPATRPFVPADRLPLDRGPLFA